MTFWDSLEHIEDMELIISKITEWAFVSIPIFDNAEHCLKSKHFRKDEHFWYFTNQGIKAWFRSQGFECVEENSMESQLGREDIKSYAFKRCT
jgi:hypothetical protein